MPRIDPLALLKCLSVLLTPEGGILSRDEVPRLVNLMTKFSKKLVSKCVYVLILKSTETVLVDMFMAEGGWTLIQTWLQDAVQTGNWDLVKEILGLLLITPVDVERLKLNILPKLIKSLSRRDELEGVSQLSTKLVQQWLVIVKGASNPVPQQAIIPEEIEIPNTDTALVEIDPKENEEKGDVETEINSTEKEARLSSRKLSEEGQVAATEEELVKVEEEKSKSTSKSSKSKSSSSRDKEKERRKERRRDKDKGQEKGKDKDKDKSREKDRKSRSSSSKRRSSSSIEKEEKDKRNKDRSDKDKDTDKYKHKDNGSLKSSSSSSKEKSKDSKDKARDKERQADNGKDKPAEKDKDNQAEMDKDNQAEKDKDTLAIIKPPTINKLGRIPKKSSSITAQTEEEIKEARKKAFSVGVRKDREERPKTVKIFHSKMRSTGLEEEVKPAPARPVKKPTPSLQLPTIPMKRPSPPRDIKDPIVPPEKKLRMDKVDIPDRPGAIKLIPPKPKPALLQESDLFMDAITAATTKKEPKKRKRRLSVTKDTNSTSPSNSPSREQPQTPTSPTQTGANTSPLGLKNIAPINFYQDTLTEEKADKADNSESNAETAEEKAPTDAEPAEKTEPSSGSPPRTPTDENQEVEEVENKRVRLDGELRGVLLYTKKKGPKRSISWKNETDLVEIRYFELDETERVNVTKTFGDMAKMDISSEREALQQSRKVGGEDSMEAQIMWRIPFVIDQEDALVVPGSKSLEKDIQFAREKSVLQALYFDKRRIPDSAEEPIPENHQMSDPIHIPLEDPEGLEMDMKSTPWPEPKGFAPLPEPVMPPMFPPIQGPYNQPYNNMPPPAFQGLPPRFAGPGGPIGPGVPNNFVPPNVMPSGNMMGPMPNHPNHQNHPGMVPPNDMMMNQMNPNMNPNMYPPGPINDGFVQGPDYPMFGNPTGPPNMYPPNNNFSNNHRPNNRGGGGFRRGSGNNNGGNWVRMSGGAGNWRRGGGHRGGRLCKNVQNHGYCRNRDNCPFVHP